MVTEFLQKFHQFQCKICTAFVDTDLNDSNDKKIEILEQHLKTKHIIDFRETKLTDEEITNFFSGNTLYIDGRAEPEFVNEAI